LLDPAGMNRTVYTIASGGMAALARLEAVSQNVANVNTAGYKAERLLFRVRPLDTTATAALAPELGRTAAQVTQVASLRDFAQGPVRPTGNPLDVALTRGGFFAVATPRGERYTRQGSFGLDAEGFLVTQQGARVQGDGGDIRVGLGEGEVTIAEDGSVSVDQTVVARLKIVTAGDPPQLVPEGAALFAAVPGVQPTPLDATGVRLEVGALEQANVDAVAAMVELVEVARGFESYMQALRRIDEVAARSITDVGRVG
jgi:flagellar basal-body rod protein FlgF